MILQQQFDIHIASKVLLHTLSTTFSGLIRKPALLYIAMSETEISFFIGLYYRPFYLLYLTYKLASRPDSYNLLLWMHSTSQYYLILGNARRVFIFTHH